MVTGNNEEEVKLNVVEYLTYTSGLATGGKIQGIIYTEDIPKDYHGESEFVEYKEIKHPWFSFFESDY